MPYMADLARVSPSSNGQKDASNEDICFENHILCKIEKNLNRDEDVSF